MKATNEQIAKIWVQTLNYAEVGRKLGITKQAAQTRIMKMRAEGLDLPASRPRGYWLTSERAKQIGTMRKIKDGV